MKGWWSRLAYEMVTRTGRSFWEMTALMQNAIRRGEYGYAGYAAWEMLTKYETYLWKRLLVISAEDCYGVITKEIITLMDRGGEENLTKAISLMCASKKNRDADYFVCNLMFQDGEQESNKVKLAQLLHTAIRKKDIYAAGRYAAILFKTDRKRFWKMLEDTANLYYPVLAPEVEALHEANKRMSKPAEETIFVAKAIVLFWTAEKKDQLLGYPAMRMDSTLSEDDFPKAVRFDECPRVGKWLPDWSYNWHTSFGKYKLKRDVVDAITMDQEGLRPLEENLFDRCTWNRDINVCLLKHNPKKYPLPYNDGKNDPGAVFAE